MRYVVLSIAVLVCLAHSVAFAADATSFDPVPIPVNAVPGGPPVGTYIYWGSTSIPDGWLACNGQTFLQADYPDLYNVLGGNRVPDLRGEFLRVWDGGRGIDSGRALRSSQGDAIRNITGEFYDPHYRLLDGRATTSGAIYARSGGMRGTNSWSGGGTKSDTGLAFDASRQVPTADENRPRNVALMVIVKAK